MKLHPILFNGEMVRAILEGRKTQTRRPLVPQPWRLQSMAPGGSWAWSPDRVVQGGGQLDLLDHRHMIWADMNGRYRPGADVCPIQPQDRIWVRETFVLEETDELPTDGRPYQEQEEPGEFGRYLVPHYRATEPEPHIVPLDLSDSYDDRTRWRPSIHMPRWASRITLEITDVRVWRVQDITAEDAAAEGVDEAEAIAMPCNFDDALIGLFSVLWESLYADRGLGWDLNPWVWVLEFRRDQ